MLQKITRSSQARLASVRALFSNVVPSLPAIRVKVFPTDVKPVSCWHKLTRLVLGNLLGVIVLVHRIPFLYSYFS